MAGPPLTVVDVANLLGSRPDGWWRDRVGATRRLLEKMARLPLENAEMVAVLEGQARAATPEGELARGLRVVHAPRSGDDQIIAIISAAVRESRSRAITVITADRPLRVRAEALGATSQSPFGLRDRLDAAQTTGPGDASG